MNKVCEKYIAEQEINDLDAYLTALNKLRAEAERLYASSSNFDKGIGDDLADHLAYVCDALSDAQGVTEKFIENRDGVLPQAYDPLTVRDVL